MINDFDYLEFDSYEFENDDLLDFDAGSKAHKAAKKDIEKVVAEETTDDEEFIEEVIEYYDEDEEE